MRRLFWAGVGAAAAVVAVQRLRTTARRYTPEGVQEQVAAARDRTGSAFRAAVETFEEARRRREQELTTTLFVEPEGGDPHAVLGRGRHRRDDAVGDPPSSSRPSGRVDPDEPLYDF